MDLPKVFLDVTCDDHAVGRIVIELRTDVTPRTCENFRALCTNERGFGYEGSPIHRIVTGLILQGGDITNRNGTGGKSIYANKFADENFVLKHTGPGDVAMVNSGPDTNSSQFYITFEKAPWLDGKYVVFGKVVEGMDIIKNMEHLGSASGKVSRKICIRKCGQLS